MKRSAIFILSIFVQVAANQSMAAIKWFNCGGSIEAKPVQEVFWNSDVNGEVHGPTFTLPAGIIMNNLT